MIMKLTPWLQRIGVILLAGCSEAPSAAPVAAEANVARASSTDQSARPIRPKAGSISENDRIERKSAAAVCFGGDYKSFFDSFVRSSAFRRNYTSPQIYVAIEDGQGNVLEGGRNQKTRRDHDDFPIIMVDYYYKPKVPIQQGDDDEHLILEINQGQTEAFVVEWARVHYDGKSEGGDDLGNAFRLNGQPFDRAGPWDGRLLFEPHENCWRLASDIRYRRD